MKSVFERGCGFESRRILDGCKQFASYYIKENKDIQMGHTKKYLKIKKNNNKSLPGSLSGPMMKSVSERLFLAHNFSSR
jgi:hypothetical protein